MDKIEKFLRKIDPKLRSKLIKAIALIAANDLDRLDIKPLKGLKNGYRCRIGNIRIVFMHMDGTNIIYDIGYRGRMYR